MRSLGANKPEMRISYFATLVSLLKNFCSITATQILDLVKKELHASGSSKSVSEHIVLLCSYYVFIFIRPSYLLRNCGNGCAH